MLRNAAALACTAALALGATVANAQTYPDRRVTLIVPFAAGGPTDVVGRVVGAALENLWKQPFGIENRPGAGAMIGSEAMARAKPDGYTLLFNGNGVVTAQIFTKNVPYNPEDFRAVAKLAGSQYVLVTNAETPARTLKEMIELAKSRPGKINYGSIEFTTYELDYALFMRKAGIEMAKVPYSSAAPIMTAVLRNEVQFYFGIQGSIAPMVADGKMIPLAMLGEVRSPLYPHVPTARELGFDFQAGFGFGILVHSKTPEPIVKKLGADIATVLKDPAVAGRLRGMGYSVPDDPLAWPAQLKVELTNYLKTAADLKIQPQ